MRIADETARKISNLRYDSDADIVYCPLPFGSVYFLDEVTEELLPGSINDYIQVMRVLGIRVNLWNETMPSPEDQEFFEACERSFRCGQSSGSSSSIQSRGGLTKVS